MHRAPRPPSLGDVHGSSRRKDPGGTVSALLALLRLRPVEDWLSDPSKAILSLALAGRCPCPRAGRAALAMGVSLCGKSRPITVSALAIRRSRRDVSRPAMAVTLPAPRLGTACRSSGRNATRGSRTAPGRLDPEPKGGGQERGRQPAATGCRAGRETNCVSEGPGCFRPARSNDRARCGSEWRAARCES